MGKVSLGHQIGEWENCEVHEVRIPTSWKKLLEGRAQSRKTDLCARAYQKKKKRICPRSQGQEGAAQVITCQKNFLEGRKERGNPPKDNMHSKVVVEETANFVHLSNTRSKYLAHETNEVGQEGRTNQ